eukprot:3952056-Prymnesium_polylepis.1
MSRRCSDCLYAVWIDGALSGAACSSASISAAALLEPFAWERCNLTTCFSFCRRSAAARRCFVCRWAGAAGADAGVATGAACAAVATGAVPGMAATAVASSSEDSSTSASAEPQAKRTGVFSSPLVATSSSA